MNETTGQILAVLLAGAIPVLLAGFAYFKTRLETGRQRELLEQMKVEAEAARLQRELAQAAAGQAEQAKQEIVTLGMALGAPLERSSGAPPSPE